MPTPSLETLKATAKAGLKIESMSITDSTKYVSGSPSGKRSFSTEVSPTVTTSVYVYQDYIDGLSEAVVEAWNNWRANAKVNANLIAGMVMGTPGCVTGPFLEDGIYSAGPKPEGWQQRCTSAVAKGMAKNWKQWTDKIIISNPFWYPPMLCTPLRKAGPIPNVPSILNLCPSSKITALTKVPLVAEFKAQIGAYTPQEGHLLEAMADGISVVFGMWVTSQMIMNVMGKGVNHLWPTPGPAFGTAKGYGFKT